EYAQKYNRKFAGFDGPAQQALRAHTWPGNVRELAHAVERAVLMSQGERIPAKDLGLQQREPSRAEDEMTLEEAERAFIRKVLAKHGGNVQAAAEQLGMSRSALYRRIQQHGLESRRTGPGRVAPQPRARARTRALLLLEDPPPHLRPARLLPVHQHRHPEDAARCRAQQHDASRQQEQ